MHKNSACCHDGSTSLSPKNVKADYLDPDFSEEVTSFYESPGNRGSLSKITIQLLYQYYPQYFHAFKEEEEKPKSTIDDEMYQEGAKAFHEKKYDEAFTLFSKIVETQPQESLPRETARYMQGRTMLVHAQEKWNGWPSKHWIEEGVDGEKVKKASDFFQLYLAEYPLGKYVGSAIGLKRRIALLMQDQTALDRLLSAHVTKILYKANKPNLVTQKELFNSIFEYFIYASRKIDFERDHPIIIARLITNLEKPDDTYLENLENKKEYFKDFPHLFSFAKVWLLYKQQKFEAILETLKNENIPDAKHFIGVNAHFLKARALRILKRYDEAIGYLLKLSAIDGLAPAIKQHIQEEIACIFYEQNKAADLFKPYKGKALPLEDSIFQNTVQFRIKTQTLETLLKDKTLGRHHLLFVVELLKRNIRQGKWQNVKRLLKRAEKIEGFEKDPFHILIDNIKPYIHDLARKKPKPETFLALAKELNNLGGYVHTRFKGWGSDAYYGYYDWYSPLTPEGRCKACNVCTFKDLTQEKPEKHVAPIDYFIKAIQPFKGKQKSDVEAEALHYLISECYRGVSPQQGCTWDDHFSNNDNYPKSGKNWFKRLHRKYKNSTWAKKTPYYYWR